MSCPSEKRDATFQSPDSEVVFKRLAFFCVVLNSQLVGWYMMLNYCSIWCRNLFIYTMSEYWLKTNWSRWKFHEVCFACVPLQ
jgi:hypothetical protein